MRPLNIVTRGRAVVLFHSFASDNSRPEFIFSTYLIQFVLIFV